MNDPLPPHTLRRAISRPGVWLLAFWLFLPALPVKAAAPLPPQQEPAPVLVPIVRNGSPFVTRTVDAIPISGPATDRPAQKNADMNLGMRSWAPAAQLPVLIDIGGPTDDDAPQLNSLFYPARLPLFASTWQVHDWDWGCGADGCQGAPLTEPPVTLLAMATGAQEYIYVPSRNAQILPGGYVAMVLYAEPARLTIKYTREDSPVYGYTIHLEGLQVDPSLVNRYAELNAAGRTHLPGLRNGDLLGMATGTLMVAVRDTGTFMDPRTRKDWWRGY